MSYATPSPWEPYFGYDELQCRCDQCENSRRWDEPIGFNGDQMSPVFMGHVLVLRRDYYGAPLGVASGFRCPNHPIPTAKRLQALRKGCEYIPGAHARGEGIDLRCSGAAFIKLMHAACAYNRDLEAQGKAPAFTGVGVSQKGPASKRYLHLDGSPAALGRPRPHGWSY
ncbi:hypothetical protein [Microbulbifer sp. PSTR4-B]|uniref:hypothetical protein n=1 Tax=unclassified Microbulbifer TaxID=2619833 RepID=UPI00403B2380